MFSYLKAFRDGLCVAIFKSSCNNTSALVGSRRVGVDFSFTITLDSRLLFLGSVGLVFVFANGVLLRPINSFIRLGAKFPGSNNKGFGSFSSTFAEELAVRSSVRTILAFRTAAFDRIRILSSESFEF